MRAAAAGLGAKRSMIESKVRFVSRGKRIEVRAVDRDRMGIHGQGVFEPERILEPPRRIDRDDSGTPPAQCTGQR